MGAWQRGVGVVAAALVAVTAVPVVEGAPAAESRPVDGLAPGTAEAAQAAARRQPTPDRGPRQATPQDRFAPAGGCYVVRSVATGDHLVVGGDTVRATAAADDATPLRFEPTALGRYLLFSPDERFVGAPEGPLADVVGELTTSSPGAMASGLTFGATDRLLEGVATGELGEATGRDAGVGVVSHPGERADWQLTEDGDAFRLALADEDAALAVADDGTLALLRPDDAPDAQRLTLHLADGCADFPDVEVNVDGPIHTGETPYGPVRGYLDPHLHGQAWEFLGGRARCGRPWHPFGVTEALKGCDEHELLDGRTHVLETFLSGRDPVEGHDTTGWPTFHDWPAHFSLTYEQTYHRWIERAWRGGVRLYVNLLVDNVGLCEVYPFRRHGCNEMDGVRRQAERMRELEAYVDAQHGGPGQGWLRIVEDPFEARRVINEGKLAVVLGIEVSNLFDCTIRAGVAGCDRAQIDRQMTEVHDLGVRQMEIVNKFDNALTGVAGDAGETGLLVNGANFLQTGSFWRMGSCERAPDDASDRTHLNVPDEADLPDELAARDALFGFVLDTVGDTGAAPLYAGGPHCNQRGLTDLGAYTIERMIERGMLFDPDHMSAVARDEAMTLIESHDYDGVVSSHSWSDAGIYERVLRVGGVVTPMAGSSRGFVEEWEQQRGWADDRYHFGIGFGSDINGFAAQGGPRGADAPNAVRYPFEGFGGAIVDRQVSGERVFDINTDGVAHYGLYPDWVEDLRRQAGDAIVEDLEQGPEAYLQTWERAVGIAPDSCRDDVPPLTDGELRAVRRGQAAEQVLLILGQPRARDGATFTHCLDRGRTAEVAFDRDGRVSRVTTRRDRVAAHGPAPVSAADVATRTAVQDATAAQPAQETALPDGTRVHVHGDEIHVVHADGTLARAATDTDRSTPIRVAIVLLGLAAVAVHRTATRPAARVAASERSR